MAVGGVAIDTCTACLAAASQSWARQPFQKVRSRKKRLVMPTTAGFLDTLAQHVLCPFRGPERPLGRWTENTHTHRAEVLSPLQPIRLTVISALGDPAWLDLGDAQIIKAQLCPAHSCLCPEHQG
jgi:hypothetical protein